MPNRYWNVFSILWNKGMESELVTSGANEFQMRSATTLKAHDAMASLVHGMMRSFFQPSQCFELERTLTVV